MNWLILRLSEPSTWRGIIGLLTALGIKISPDLQNSIIAAGLSLMGLINILIAEKRPISIKKD
jgi:hypothetical protein